MSPSLRAGALAPLLAALLAAPVAAQPKYGPEPREMTLLRCVVGLHGLVPGARRLALARGDDNYLAIIQDAASLESVLVTTRPQSIKFGKQARKACRAMKLLKEPYLRFDETGFAGAGQTPCAAGEPVPETAEIGTDGIEAFVAGVISRELVPGIEAREKELEYRDRDRERIRRASLREVIRRANVGCLDARLPLIAEALGALPNLGWKALDDDDRRAARRTQ